MMRQVRVMTTSKNPALRFFLLGFGLFLINVWVCLRWRFTRKAGSGPKRIDAVIFRFKRFAMVLRRSIEQLYGVVMAIPTHLSPQIVIY